MRYALGRMLLPVDVGAHETECIEIDYWEDSDNLAVLSESFATSRDLVKVPVSR